jgi:hypothetical protein
MVQTRRQLKNNQVLASSNTVPVSCIPVIKVAIVEPNIMHRELEVNIDFDEASKAWHANKKSIGNSHYKYICEISTKTGKLCGKVCYKCESYCWSHRKQSK